MFALIAICCSKLVLIDYNTNYTMYEVIALNFRERQLLYDMYLKANCVFFLNGVTNKATLEMYLVVPDQCTKAFERSLGHTDIEYSLGRKISQNEIVRQIHEFEIIKDNQYLNVSNGFHDLTDIEHWIDNIVKKKSHMLTKIRIGTTQNQKPLVILKVSTTEKNKTSVFILGGEEGRDWMSPAIIINFVDLLLHNEFDFQELIQYYDFYFLPIFNPDGYEHSGKTERFWAKNRNQFFPQKKCIGNTVAIGVNIGLNWNYLNTTSKAKSKCHGIYIGSKPFSDEEPRVVSDFLNQIATKTMAFINLRGFGRLITTPFANKKEYSTNYSVLKEIMKSVSYKLNKKYNVSYNTGKSVYYAYGLLGSSADWVKLKLNIPLVYTIYMKYEENPLPKPEHILPLTQQFSTILKDILSIAKEMYGPLFNSQRKSQMNIDMLTFFIILVFIINKLHF